VDADPGSGVHYYVLAANLGCAPAQVVCAQLMFRGERGMPKDTGASVLYTQLAARQRHCVAQYEYALLLSYGEGVPMDPAEAAGRFRQAADWGYDRAQYAYGLCLLDGRGVPRDTLAATEYFRLAAAQDHKEAKKEYTEACLRRL